MFRVPVITLTSSLTQDRDLLTTATDNRIRLEDDAPDNIVLLLELWALEDIHTTHTFHKRFGYVFNRLQRMVQIVDDFVKAHW